MYLLYMKCIQILLSQKVYYPSNLHVPGIGTCPVSKITLVLMKNDLRQADNSGFPGVNHPWDIAIFTN